jgi:hypothetical protein
MVTATATLIAAIAGLVTAVTQLRGGDHASSGPPGVTTIVATDTAALRELRSHIPAAIRPTCGPPKYPEENAVAAFNCTYREIVGLQYNLFASDADLKHGIQRVKKRYGSRTHVCGSKPLALLRARRRRVDRLDRGSGDPVVRLARRREHGRALRVVGQGDRSLMQGRGGRRGRPPRRPHSPTSSCRCRSGADPRSGGGRADAQSEAGRPSSDRSVVCRRWRSTRSRARRARS